jgi:hypothetical protein
VPNIAKHFDEEHLQSTLSWLSLLGGTLSGLVVLWFALSPVLFFLLAAAFLGVLLWLGRVWSR